jgi:hypothetical protein
MRAVTAAHVYHFLISVLIRQPQDKLQSREEQKRGTDEQEAEGGNFCHLDDKNTEDAQSRQLLRREYTRVG